MRYLDRSRRANNPENYNDDGTIKKGRKKLKWKKSKKYIKTQNKLKDLYRKQADIRTLQHWELANEIVKLGDTVIVEKMNFKALQKRTKETKKKENGRFKSKKRFGKSLGEKAPAKFLNILKYKITSLGGNYYECETKDIKASQYNHITDDYEKKKLSNRWNNFGEYKVQRDLYSAFLIQHVNEDLKTIDREGCINDFNNFKMLHDKEIERLKKSTLSKALRNVL